MAAALVAVVAGWRTITAEVLQPRRRNALSKSVLPLSVKVSDDWHQANAFCVGPGKWLTVGWAISKIDGQVADKIVLRAEDGPHTAKCSAATVTRFQLVLLEVEGLRRPALRLGPSVLSVNDPVAVSVATRRWRGHDEIEVRQLTLEYKYLGSSSRSFRPTPTVPADSMRVSDQDSETFLALGGPLPDKRTGGAPVLDVRSGRVCGVLSLIDQESGALATAFAIPVDGTDASWLRRWQSLLRRR